MRDHYAFSEAWTARHPNKSKNCDHCILFCCLLHWFRSFWRDKLHTQLNISIQVYFNISCKQCILFPVMQLSPPKQKNTSYDFMANSNQTEQANIKSNNPHLTGGEKPLISWQIHTKLASHDISLEYLSTHFWWLTPTHKMAGLQDLPLRPAKSLVEPLGCWRYEIPVSQNYNPNKSG